MTTLWARMLVIKAWEKGEITEECAHYFDELLNNGQFRKLYVTDKPSYITDFNGELNYCVLGNTGMKNITLTHEPNFHISTYISKTAFENGYTKGNETVYLANIINEDLKQLPNYILKHVEYWNSFDELQVLKNYLEKTSYKCCANEEIKKTLIEAINMKEYALLNDKYKNKNNYDNEQSNRYRRPDYDCLG